jgi:hypothetical protein
MKKIMKASLLLCGFALTLLVFYGCQKDAASGVNTEGKQQVHVYLNDDPSFDFTKVLIDIRYVEVKIDSLNGNHDHDNDDDGDDDHLHHDNFGYWDTLGVTPGIYDLLRLRNGVDTLLASGLVGSGRITKIRFTLGTSNAVWTDSTHSEPLSICDGRPYVYVKLLTSSIDTLPGGQSVIRIDFNVEKSIKKRNGHYCLQPELRSYCNSRSGGIEGKILPHNVITLIKVYNSTDTAYAVPFPWNGEFKVRGLNEGNYSVLYDALSPYQDTLITNIQVLRGRETELPVITLHH